MAGSGEERPRQRREAPQESEAPPIPAPKPLPKSIQETLDSDEKLWELMYEGKYVLSLILPHWIGPT